MHTNAALVTQFSDALARRDGDAMAACYHPEVHFQDPVFDLRGPRAGAMWRMLCARGNDLAVVASGITADDDAGAAHWEADYTFSTTGRPVHNVIDAAFTFRDGLIATHRDTFSLWAWTRQALGAPGLLLGWSPLLQRRVRATAAQSLDAYIERHPEALG
ncbi:nuclear transport factor 2 family protein [Rubrivirga sp. IMCC43871]|uniref:nuclear transport factor 2 family protein n=1 Tax=Rubrivirga sp. IMCC43871 TaxID=3391575 RepID=UPI003990379D